MVICVVSVTKLGPRQVAPEPTPEPTPAPPPAQPPPTAAQIAKTERYYNNLKYFLCNFDQSSHLCYDSYRNL